MRLGVGLVVVGSLLASVAWADPHPARPRRPRHATSIEPLEPGSLQFELGYVAEHTSGPAPSWWHWTPMQARLQATPTIELQLGFDGVGVHEGRAGAGDPWFGVVAVPLPEDGLAPAVGLHVRLGVPLGNEGFGADGVRLQAGVALTGHFGRLVRLDLDLGVRSRVSAGSGDSLVLPAAVAATVTVFDLVDVIAEVSGDFDLLDLQATPVLRSLVAAGWHVADTLVVDAGAELGLTEQAPDVRIVVGLSWNLADMY